MENDFVILLTGAEDSTSLARAFLERTGRCVENLIPFRLSYVQPFKRFSGIQELQLRIKYRPFLTEPRRDAVVILDLSEWIGHEEEEYIRIFFRYLHDQAANGYFRPEYILTLGPAVDQNVQKMHRLASEYLRRGSVVLDRTLQDREALSTYLRNTYPLNAEAADKLAEIYLQKPIPSLQRVHMLTEDLLLRTGTEGMITGRKLMQAIPDSKLSLFYGEAVVGCFRERMEEGEKNEQFA